MRDLNHIPRDVKFFIDLSKIEAVMSRRFDNALGGLGWNEFIILYHLSQAEEGSLRRIDLAEKIGLTASGVTRILFPMEKVGYVKRQANRNDARSSLVLIAPGGAERFREAIERAEFLVDDLIPGPERQELSRLEGALSRLSKLLK